MKRSCDTCHWFDRDGEFGELAETGICDLDGSGRKSDGACKKYKTFHKCKSCKWFAADVYVCTCDRSDNCADFVDEMECSCEHWEEADDERHRAADSDTGHQR